MDSFLDDVDFSSLRIDPINYDIPPSSLISATGEHKFTLPKWANFPGQTNGVVLHEIRDGKNIKILDLDKSNKMYYLFGRSPKIVCNKGISIPILHRNASRTHFALLHSKFESLYLIDLGSVHGTFIGKKRIQSYQPIQLSNGNVLSIGGCSFKFVVRVFPKKPGELIPFSGFTMNNTTETNFDTDTTLHTHLNQVPEVLSPKGKHLVKPLSVINLKTSNFAPVPLLPDQNFQKKNLIKPFSMYNLKQDCFDSNTRLKRKNSYYMDIDIEDTIVEKLDLSKPILLKLPKPSISLSTGGILKKSKSIHFKRLQLDNNSLRKVSFCDIKQNNRNKHKLKATKSTLLTLSENTRVNIDSEDEEEAIEIEAFDPTRDLPDNPIDLSKIEETNTLDSPSLREKSTMLRTYSVKNVRSRDNTNFSFPSISDIRRRGEGFENASPLAREGYIKRHRSERDLFSA